MAIGERRWKEASVCLVTDKTLVLSGRATTLALDHAAMLVGAWLLHSQEESPGGR